MPGISVGGGFHIDTAAVSLANGNAALGIGSFWGGYYLYYYYACVSGRSLHAQSDVPLK